MARTTRRGSLCDTQWPTDLPNARLDLDVCPSIREAEDRAEDQFAQYRVQLPIAVPILCPVRAAWHPTGVLLWAPFDPSYGWLDLQISWFSWISVRKTSHATCRGTCVCLVLVATAILTLTMLSAVKWNLIPQPKWWSNKRGSHIRGAQDCLHLQPVEGANLETQMWQLHGGSSTQLQVMQPHVTMLKPAFVEQKVQNDAGE